MTVPRRSAKSGNSHDDLDLVTQKSAKKKGKKSTKASAQPGVLGSLRTTRPERIGGSRRDAARAQTSVTTALATEAVEKPAKAKPAAETKPAKATKAEVAAAAKPKTAKKAKPAKPEAAKAKPKKAKAKPAKAKPEPMLAAPAKGAKVKPVKRVVPKPEPAAKRPPKPLPPEGDGRASGPPRGTEIVTTAVQAAGELAQIGVTVGGQLLRRAARRIPGRD
jgi:hypothetical protein